MNATRVGWIASFVIAVMLSGSVARADIVHNDDVIIIGSLNVGFDAVNGKVFGFDTIILSENNLRILFEDTSNTASFPSNDWRLTANDSTNGGVNHFSIDDVSGSRAGVFRVEAGAAVASLHVDSTSRIGLKTANPVVELHIADGDTPTVRLEQNGTSGFTPQTWDLAGNETNFFIRDVTNASRLPFRIRPGALTSSLDIAADGDIGIGTSSPSSSTPFSLDEAAVHILRGDGDSRLFIQETSGTTATRQMIELSNNGGPQFAMHNSNSNEFWTFGMNAANDFVISQDGTGSTEFQILSDLSGTPGLVNITHGLNVVGNVSKGGGSFKIDHPLDPENKYLFHSFVESPEMMNVYNGNTKLDNNGEAWVELPSYFETLNREFRYQLTSIGGAAPSLHVIKEIEGNRFKIAGGVAEGRVSWQVTGVRQDPFAKANPVIAEVDKPEIERGSYLHPEAYGQPKTKGVQFARTAGELADNTSTDKE